MKKVLIFVFGFCTQFFPGLLVALGIYGVTHDNLVKGIINISLGVIIGFFHESRLQRITRERDFYLKEWGTVLQAWTKAVMDRKQLAKQLKYPPHERPTA